jgi:aldose 1-epimerase
VAQSGSLLSEGTARSLAAGELLAVFLPGKGMLGASLRYRGQELLGRVEDLDGAAHKGSTAGIPLLYPLANRLPAAHYEALGKKVVLDTSSPLVHLDENGLPIHGVPWAQLAWDVTEAGASTLAAQLEWTREDLLGVFPFRHRVGMRVVLHPDALMLETTVQACFGDAVPVAFGFHPYLAPPGAGRDDFRLVLPSMRRWVLDARGLPTGEETAFAGFDGALAARAFDDGFSLLGEPARLSIASPEVLLGVDFLSGYGAAQVFAPRDKGYVALEPMTAPTGALGTGRGLRTLPAGGQFRAAFRISVTARA